LIVPPTFEVLPRPVRPAECGTQTFVENGLHWIDWGLRQSEVPQTKYSSITNLLYTFWCWNTSWIYFCCSCQYALLLI
jgi:hypothetical protein